MGWGVGAETTEARSLLRGLAGRLQSTQHLDCQACLPSGCGNQEARVRAPREGAASGEGSPSLGPEPTSYFTTGLGRWPEGLSLLGAPSPPPFCTGRPEQPGLGASRRQDGRGRPGVRQTRLCAFGPSDHGGLHGEPQTQVDAGLRLLSWAPRLTGLHQPRVGAGGGLAHTPTWTTVRETAGGPGGAGRTVLPRPGRPASARQGFPDPCLPHGPGAFCSSCQVGTGRCWALEWVHCPSAAGGHAGPGGSKGSGQVLSRGAGGQAEMTLREV